MVDQKYVIWMVVGCCLAVVVFVILVLGIYRHKKRRKKHQYQIEGIKYKSPSKPFFDIPRIKAQLEHLEDPDKLPADDSIKHGEGYISSIGKLPNEGMEYEEPKSEIIPEKCEILPVDALKAEVVVVWASCAQSLSCVLKLINIKRTSGQIFVKFLVQKNESEEKNDLIYECHKEYEIDTYINFSIKDLSWNVLATLSLCVEIFERKFKFGKEARVGIGQLPLKYLNMVPDKPLEYHVIICPVEQACLANYNSDVGSISIIMKRRFVGQIYAEIGIGLKMAELLPFHKVGSEYKAELFVLRKEERMSYFTTAFQSGTSPFWNDSFSFDVLLNNISEYSMDIVIMRLGRFHGSSIISRLRLYHNDDSNTLYLNEVIKNTGGEITFKKDLLPFEVTKRAPSEKYMGLVKVSLRNIVSSSRHEKEAEFELLTKEMAHFQYNKSGGNYRVEISLRKQKQQMEKFVSNFTTHAYMNWKHSCIFVLGENKIDDIEISISILRTGRMKRSQKIGSLTLQTKHIQECQNVPNLSVEKWYCVKEI